MLRIDVSDLDLTRELRLRRWARENFVAPAERDTGWHPVVLQEMQLIDEEREPRVAVDRRRARPHVDSTVN